MIHPEIRQTAKQLPLPFMLQSLSLLGMDFEQLEEYVRSVVLSNPLLEYPGEQPKEDYNNYISSLPDKSRSLYTMLLQQLHTTAGLMPELVAAAELLIGCIDEDGYLRVEPEELERDGFFNLQLLLRALKLIQGFEPFGVGARDLRECLLLQLDHMEGDTACAREIVQHHLNALPDHLPVLPGFSPEETASAVACIRSLSPRPGLSVPSDDLPPAAIPEIEIFTDDEGGLHVRPLFPMDFPRFSDQYRRSFLAVREEEAAIYIRKQADAARRLIHAVRRRHETLLAIGECIAQCQRAYFAGSAGLNPLTIAEIARLLSLSSSTVSRGIRGKYLLFRGSVYPLKAFLSSMLSSGHSADQVKKKIREILLLSPDKRISDREISERLAQLGIQVARRTVNKYRRDMIGRKTSLK